MTKQTDFQNWLDELRQTTDYRAANAAIDFIVECEMRRDELGLTYADLARKLNVSRARINQLFRGETNMTVRTMQELADALGLALEIKTASVGLNADKRLRNLSVLNTWTRNGDDFGDVNEDKSKDYCGSAA